MALILTPNHTSLTGLPRLRTTHPLTQGLVSLYVAHPAGIAGTSWRNLVAGAPEGILTSMDANTMTAGLNSPTRPGAYGEVNFDGSADYVDLGTNGTHNVTGEMAFFGWIKSRDVTVSQALISMGSVASPELPYGIILARLGVSGALTIRWGDTDILEALTGLVNNTWYHVGFVRRGTTGAWALTVYVNGDAISSTTTTTNPSSAAAADIATLGRRGSLAFSQWNGAIEQAWLYNRPLNNDEVRELYFDGLRGSPGTLQAPYTLLVPHSTTVTTTTVTISPAKLQWKASSARDFRQDIPPTKWQWRASGITPTEGSFPPQLFIEEVLTYNMDETVQVYLQTTSPDTGEAFPAISLPDLTFPESSSVPLIPDSALTLVSVDSEDVAGGHAGSKAIDDNPATFWQTVSGVAHPHTIILDLGHLFYVTGFRYLPRQDGGTAGTIEAYQIYVSTDGSTWGDAVRTGSMDENTDDKSLYFDPTLGRYVKFVAVSDMDGTTLTTIAEFGVYGSMPTYAVYEETGGTPLLEGYYTPQDTSNVTGLYVASFTPQVSDGFDSGKLYVIRSQWQILDTVVADITLFTVSQILVTILPAQLQWKPQVLTGRNLALTPARWQWQTGAFAAPISVTIDPARVQWQPQGILGCVLAVAPAKWRWQSPAPSNLLNLFLPATRLVWQPQAVEITLPFPTGEPLAALAEVFIAGDWLIQSQRLALRLSLSYNPDGTWEHRLMDIGDVEVSVGLGGGLATVANMTFTVAEDGTGMSMLERWRRLATIGGTADITMDFLAGDGTTLRVFTGIIDTITLRNGMSQVLCVDESIQRNFQLPQTLITSNLYALAASASLAQPLPLVYGLGSHLGNVPLLLTNTSNLGYTAAAHAMSMTTQIAVFNTPAQTFMPGGVSGLAVDNTATTFLSTPIQQQVLNLQSGVLQVLTQQNVLFPQFAVDGLSTTITRVTTSGLASNFDGQGLLGVVATPTSAQRGNNQTVITLTGHRRALGSDPTVTGQFIVQTVDIGTGAVLRSALFTTESFRHSLNPQTTIQTVPNLNLGEQEAVEVVLQARNEGGPGGVSNFYEVQGISIQTGYQPSGDNFPIFLTGNFNGRRDATGQVTPNGANTLYTLPNHVIGSLLVDELGLDIATALVATNTTYSLRQFNFDGGIGYGWHVTRAQARQILQDAAWQATAILALDLDGKWSLRPYEEDSFPVLGFDLDTMLCEDGAEDANASDATEVVLGNMENVHCRFEVHYAWNTGSQKFDQVLYASESGSNATDTTLRQRCQLSALRYGITEPLIVNAYWISEPTAAEALLEHLVAYFSFQRIMITFVSTLRALTVRLGDFVTIEHPLLPEGDTGGDFEVHAIRIAPKSGRITLSASKRATVYLEYFTIRDQTDVTWFWWFDEAGQLTRDSSIPVIAPLLSLNITPGSVAPHWLQVHDATNTSWYLYPDELGQLVIDTVPPAQGAGIDVGTGLTAIGLDAQRYRLGATGAPEAMPLISIETT